MHLRTLGLTLSSVGLKLSQYPLNPVLSDLTRQPETYFSHYFSRWFIGPRRSCLHLCPAALYFVFSRPNNVNSLLMGPSLSFQPAIW